MNVSDILLAARTILLDRRKWTTRAMARDSSGNKIWPEDPAACKFCAMGAVFRAADEKVPDRIERDNLAQAARSALNEATGETDAARRNIAFVNDGEDGYTKVLAAYDRAIEVERRRERRAT